MRCNLAEAQPQPRVRSGAFSLIELLVAVAVVSTLVALSVPFLAGTIRSSSQTMAINSIESTATAARNYATRYLRFNTPDAFGRTSDRHGDGYSGAAVIVTPANELRLAANDEFAAFQNGTRLDPPLIRDSEPGDPNNRLVTNGYSPIEGVGDLSLPRGLTIFGVVRNSASELLLLPPPFAISFNNNGELVSQSLSQSRSFDASLRLRRLRRADGFVYYDANGDGAFNINADRQTVAGTGRTLADFRRDSAPIIALRGSDPEAEPMAGRRELPFEKLETVVAVVVIPTDRIPARFYGSGGDDFDPDRISPIEINTANTSENLLSWASQSGNGQIIFFNRASGERINR